MVKTILVSIICFEDLDVLKTVADLYATASHPQRIRTSVILQTDTPELFRGLEHYAEVIYYPASWAEGCGKARAEAFKQHQDEDFFFQIDSHMRFERHWDDLLITEAVECPSDKPILTTLPTGFVIATEQKHEACYNIITFREFYRHVPCTWGMHTLIRDYAPTPKPETTPFLAGGCLFAPGSIAKIGCDPGMYFHGEEHSLNMRLWTHGYDNFAPRFSYIYHAYRVDQINHVTLQSKIDPHRDRELAERSLARVQVLTGVKKRSEVPAHYLDSIDDYPLGTARTVADWEQHFGFDLKKQTRKST